APLIFPPDYTLETGESPVSEVPVKASKRMTGVSFANGRAYLGLDIDERPFLLLSKETTTKTQKERIGKHGKQEDYTHVHKNVTFKLVQAPPEVVLPNVIAFIPEPPAAKRWQAPAKARGDASKVDRETASKDP